MSAPLNIDLDNANMDRNSDAQAQLEKLNLDHPSVGTAQVMDLENNETSQDSLPILQGKS